MGDDYELAGEFLAHLAVSAEEAAEDADAYPRAVLERVARRLSELSDALASRDVAEVERLCPDE
jgi:Mn-dependent DtxR family transcriptional regulator